MDATWTIALTTVAVIVAGLTLRRWPVARVHPGEVGLEFRNGRQTRQLGPGRYLRPLTLDDWHVRVLPAHGFAGYGAQINVLTADQFAFRLALTPLVEITDPAQLIATQPHLDGALPASPATEALLPHLQAATLAEIARLTLDQVLADRDGLIARLTAALRDAVPGLTVTDLLLTDLTMPPELRRMFTEVERARHEGLAALERARTEQAALRALANAARSLEANPALAHLRVLHAMETARGAKTFVLGVTDPALSMAVPSSVTRIAPPGTPQS